MAVQGRVREARLDSIAVDGDRISARLALAGREHELAYRVTGVPLRERYDPFLIAALPLAMRAASTLTVPGPVSPRLLDSLDTIQRILTAWYGELRTIDVDAPRGAEELDGKRGAASFFSGGVDSFHTVLGNRDDLDALVFISGFELGGDGGRAKDARIRPMQQDIAAELGLPLVEVDSNLRAVSSSYLPIFPYHGALLASVGMVLGGGFRRVLIPASYSYRVLLPWGSHPLLDPMWSTEAVEIVHDGVARRVDKLERIADSEIAMRWLRVCWDPDADYNCGRCQKCLRTMAGLRIVGALERCETLPDEVPIKMLSRTRIREMSVLAFMRENLEAAEARGVDPELTRALRRVVRRGSRYVQLKPLGAERALRMRHRAGRIKRVLLRSARRRATATAG